MLPNSFSLRFTMETLSLGIVLPTIRYRLAAWTVIAWKFQFGIPILRNTNLGQQHVVLCYIVYIQLPSVATLKNRKNFDVFFLQNLIIGMYL